MKFDPSLPEEGINVSETHPLRETATLLGGLVAIVVLCVAVVSLAADRLVPRLPPDLEARLFSASWFESDDEQAETDPRRAPVAALLERLAAHWEENPYPSLQLRIWEESQPNALAFPGGLVVVTTGLLDAVESENELAFVLAHELGHFRNRDHLRGLGRGLALGLVLAAVGVGGDTPATDLAARAGELTTRGFDRAQERTADRFGLGLVVAEYGHVAGAVDFFRKLPDAGESGAGKRLAGYLSTHPLSDARIDALEQLARERSWPTEGAPVPFAAAAE